MNISSSNLRDNEEQKKFKLNREIVKVFESPQMTHSNLTMLERKDKEA